MGNAGHVSGAEVELRTIAIEERGVAAALFLGQDVNLAEELGVRGHGTRLGQNLAALDLVTLDAAEQNAHVVASLSLVKQLAEHLDAGNDGLGGLADADDLDRVAHVQDATLDTTGGNGATAGDGHYVLDSHQERLVDVALRGRDVVVNSVHKLVDSVDPLGLAVEGAKGGTLDDGQVVSGELVVGEELAGLHLDELDELFVVNHVALVQEDNDPRHTDLTGEQDVLAGLSHRAVGGGDDQDSAVHLGSTGDHVLDVVSVTRAVNVRVVALPGLILDMSDGNRNAALALFGGLVDVLECGEVGLAALGLGQNLGDGCGERRLAVVNVADGADVHVRLGALELCLSHAYLLKGISAKRIWY